MKGYVFISNSTKPSEEKANKREIMSPSNVSRPCLEAALDMGYEVFWGVNKNNPEELKCDLPVKLFDSHTYRSITAIKDNWVAFKNLRRVIKNNDIKVIHCNTPVGGMIGRICGKLYNVDKVIYTAHGFHFYKGAPLINRTLFKWAEQIMAHWTDVIITMNQEDYEAAKRFRLKKNGKVYKVHGVGITLSDFEKVTVNKSEVRKNLGLKDTDIVCISAGDLVPRKNYQIAIKAIAKAKNPNLHYLICGIGSDMDRLKRLAENLNISNQIHFLGFRTDMIELFKSSDIFLFTSLQEGLPRSLMEAMACGLPCVVSKIRGNVDLIIHNVGGYLCDVNSYKEYAEKIKTLSTNRKLALKMSENNLETIKKFDISVVTSEINKIYHGC
jgi:glycosyltransferase involved in cell wall biosynthesis